MPRGNPVSPKVVGAAIGAGAGTVVSTLIIWLLGATVWQQGFAADHVDNALASVPTPLTAFIFLLITVGSTFLPGYQVTDPLRQPTRNQAAGTGVGG